jgi:hypothetical protein
MIANVAYTLVFSTGLFPDACRAWQVRPAAQKSWTNIKVHLSAAHREFRLTNHTAKQSGFYSDNMMIEYHPYHVTVYAIAQLAVATASDRHGGHFDCDQCQANYTTRNVSSLRPRSSSKTLLNCISRSKLIGKVKDQPRLCKMISIVGRMAIKCITSTQAQVSRIRRKDTRKKRTRTTQWA